MSPQELDQVYMWWHFANLVLSISGMSLIGGKAHYMWKYLDAQSKFLYLAAFFFCVTIIWTSVELLMRHIPGGPRTIVGTIPLLWIIIAGLMPSSFARMSALERMRQELDDEKRYKREQSDQG